MTQMPAFLVTLWRKVNIFLSRERISLMEDEEFVKALKRLGLWDELQAGHLTCHHCGTALSNNNVAALVSVRGEYRLICDSNDCVGRVQNNDKP